MNFDPDTEHGARNRLIGLSVLGLVAVGVVVGLLVGGLGLAAVRTADLESAEPVESSEPTVEETEPTEPEETEPTEPEETEPTREPRPPRPDRAELEASPASVAAFDDIDLTGAMPEVGAGVVLQVQRREGGSWVDFAGVTAVTGDGGGFSTFVQTGQSGRNFFRLYDPISDTATRRAAVQVD